jgi:acetyl-CoA synthetase
MRETKRLLTILSLLPEALPKTRSGKIMRRLLREIAAGAGIQGDVTTLEDFSVPETLRTGE